MFQKIYCFNWNITDAAIERQQQSTFERITRMWREETNEIFSSLKNLFDAIFFTHQLLSDSLVMAGFLNIRKLVKILARLMTPGIAGKISKWGEEGSEPWSFALFHEGVING